jgi:large conductance mechanosensitive channel
VIKDFKVFILRGNVVDLAVGIVIGAAFGAVVTSFVNNILTPLIGIPGKADFASLHFTINGSVFSYGAFLNSLISFLSIAIAVFFVVVKPINALNERRQRGEEKEPGTRDCPECLSEINALAKRCSYCTAEVAPAA